MRGGGKGGGGSRELQEQQGLNQSRMPDRKHEVFNYTTSPEKIFSSANSLSPWGVSWEMGGM